MTPNKMQRTIRTARKKAPERMDSGAEDGEEKVSMGGGGGGVKKEEVEDEEV